MSNKTQLQTNNTALDALITRVNAAKDVAASLPEAGGGGSGGIQYEIITIPAGATSATYTLPRVTNAVGMYGGRLGGGELDSSASEGSVILGITNDLMIVAEMWDDMTFGTESYLVYYNKGTINFNMYSSAKFVSAQDNFQLILINDSSKEPLYTCTPS